MNSHSFCRTVLFATILSLLDLPAFSAAQEAHPPHWDYSGPEDPSHWGKLDPSYAACSLGRMQSPINITYAKSADLPALKLDYKAIPLNIIDNGHTIQVNTLPGASLPLATRRTL